MSHRYSFPTRISPQILLLLPIFLILCVAGICVHRPTLHPYAQDPGTFPARLTRWYWLQQLTMTMSFATLICTGATTHIAETYIEISEIETRDRPSSKGKHCVKMVLDN